MQQRALLMQIEQLKKQLQELETAVEGEEVPVTALEGLKEAVDNVRTTLWATMSTHADPFEIGSALAELRIKRTTEMCRRIMLDIDASEITLDAPGLLALRNVLNDTADRVQRLYKSGM